MTCLWAEGDPCAVVLDTDGLPAHLRWRGGQHTVAAITNRWRVDEGWWLRRTWREYVTLTTSSGLLLTLFRDLDSGAWYVQRLYD